jgi:hypothetical protein
VSSAATQIELPFPSLDFSGRGAVTLGEIALKLHLSIDHLAHLIEDGSLVAVNATRKQGSRPTWRVPLDEYRRFVFERLTNKERHAFIRGLPAETLREIRKEIDAALKHAA